MLFGDHISRSFFGAQIKGTLCQRGDIPNWTYLVKQDNPFKQVRSLAQPTVSEWHFVKKQFPSTLTECPAAANLASSSSAKLVTAFDPIIAGISAIAMKARRV